MILVPFVVGDVLRGGAIGDFDMAAWGIGAAILLLGWLRGRAQRLMFGTCVAAATTYTTLLVGEAAMSLLDGPQRTRDWRVGLAGVFRPAAPHSYEMLPGWKGHFDDGVVRHEIHIDDHGNRDEVGRQGAERTVLLLGDSFAFGFGIERDACIDRRMEDLSGHRWNVINLGVPGYGPWDSLERFERSRLAGNDLVFLLFTNDLRADQATAGNHTAVAGVIAPRKRSDGLLRTYDEDDVHEHLSHLGSSIPTTMGAIKEFLRLQRVRGRISGLLDPESRLVEGASADYRPEGVASTVAAMQSLAQEAQRKGMTFTVFVAPTMGEAQAKRHCRPMADCIQRLREGGIAVIELLPDLVHADYLAHDGHFGPSGADAAARSMVAHLRR